LPSPKSTRSFSPIVFALLVVSTNSAPLIGSENYTESPETQTLLSLHGTEPLVACLTCGSLLAGPPSERSALPIPQRIFSRPVAFFIRFPIFQVERLNSGHAGIRNSKLGASLKKSARRGGEK
jgi:hypothetical protein